MTMQDPVSADLLTKFEFSEESLVTFRKNKNIHLDLYDRDGRIIMAKKKNPTEADFGLLLKFELQGAYCLMSDLNKTRKVETGNSKEVKLFDPERTRNFAKQTEALHEELKKENVSNDHATIIYKAVGQILDDFTSNPDFEFGLFNILEVLNGAGVSLESELMTKRTVVAMGMKVRTKKIVADEDRKPNKKEHLAIMTASFLADIGFTKLNIPEKKVLSKEEYLSIQQHPTLSYLMTLSASEITSEIRTLVLNHHRPFRGSGPNNNFPETKNIYSKLMLVRDRFVKDISKSKIVADIDAQIKIHESNVAAANFEEDIAILSLASDYASLTSNQFWRPAYDSATALKLIINDSFFAYSNKSIRHLIDYVGASLTNNENIIKINDFVITASIDSEKQAHFDVCKVLELDRYQTRPKIQRIGLIKPIINKDNKYRIVDFDTKEVRLDKRRAIVDLANQTSSTQRIVYLVDPLLNAELYDAVVKLNSQG